MIKPHIPQVAYIRAVASLAVALFHMGGKSLPLLNYGWTGVEMFFLLSGFIVCWSIPENYSPMVAFTFVCKRIIRIEPPYIISVLLAVAAHFVFKEHYKADWLNILMHLVYINNFFHLPTLNPVYWTLAIEFQFYLILALFFPLVNKRWSPLLLTALSALSLKVHLNVSNL
jgi:peptidoglycan/LPS O-acetylase OafA/YrhL